ncbi:MAG: metallophosphoesterase [Oscillospiraceae bacterium]
MTYVMSDLHGAFNRYITMLEKIDFGAEDELYVIGDVVDRGEQPMEILFDMMTRANVYPLMGNHEVMALNGLKLLSGDISTDIVNHLSSEQLEMMSAWIKIGATSTIKGFTALGSDKQTEILEYISGFLPYKKVSAGRNDYLLVHAGIDGFDPDKPLDEYPIDALVWGRIDYEIPYYDNIYTVSGHTPTQGILGNPRPGYIFRANNHIAIDCGACRRGGRLACLCLDTLEEFYV